MPLRAKIRGDVPPDGERDLPGELGTAALLFPAMLIRMRTGFGPFLLIDVPVFLLGTVSVYLYYCCRRASWVASTAACCARFRASSSWTPGLR